ncbi:fibronectin type III domain-containing protein [Cohnella hashimotonis]|uniref:Fibronectin type III domain-containing protein n=1 Tax=Cohnella hashimotonis TaxID=2826895 RepID=A0ABT6TKK5_9BACL|nr:fibronectin type III domain-containing protein [Cohnella hashimotonis]MDI4647387.1 fibronectin type III domain-containing protein [Cohnella hashimotonis]
MKKVLLILFAMTLFIPIIGTTEKASAYVGGLIAPNPLKDYVDQITTKYTDNNEATGVGISSSNYVWYEFDSPKTIKSYKMKANWDVDIKFYDSTGTLLHTEHFLWKNSENSQHNNLADPVSNVSKVMFYPKTGMYIWELDVFDTLAPGSVVIPSNPVSLSAVSGDTLINLSWTAVSGATSYVLKRSPAAGGPYTTIATSVTGTSYNDTGLTNGTKYYYVVTAVNTSGESGNSNEASATPTAPVSSGRALLTIHLVGGTEKEYDLSAAELEYFLDWTDSATQSSRYKFVKTWSKGPFKARAEYIVYGKIVNFDVDEYEPVQ